MAYGLVAFSALSVRISEPEIGPVFVGVKLIEYTQEAPGASVPGQDELLSTGHIVRFPRLKLAEMLGLVPEAGVGKVSAEVPTFWTVTVCGLSTLVEPTAVVAKISLGGIEKFSFNTELYFGKPDSSQRNRRCRFHPPQPHKDKKSR